MSFYDGYDSCCNILMQELGPNPQGIYASVRTRLDILEARINNPFAPAPNVNNPFYIGGTGVTIQTGFGNPNSVLAIPALSGSLFLREDGYSTQGLYSYQDGYWYLIGGGSSSSFTAGGDLSGTELDQTVIGIQDIPVSSTAPTTGQVLEYNGTHYVPTTISSGVTWSNDLATSTNTNQEVVGLLNHALPSLTDGYLNWTGSAWRLSTVSGGGGGSGTTSLFVFQPGGTPGGNVYTDEASLAAAIGSIEGATLFFDLSISGPYTFATIGNLNLGQFTTWTDGGAGGGSGSVINFNNGTTLSYPPVSIEGDLAVYVNQAANLCTLTANSFTSLYDETAIGTTTSGLFVDASSFPWTVFLYGVSTITGSVPFSTGSVTVNLFDGSSISSTAVNSTVSFSTYSSGANISASNLPYLSIAGLYVDQSGTATANVPPGGSFQQYIFQLGQIYYSNGASWLPLPQPTNTVSTATYTINSSHPDYYIYVAYSSTGACTITMPTPTAGATYYIKDTGGLASTNNITIVHNALEKIDGANSYVLNLNHASVQLGSDGTNWFVMSAYSGTPV